MLFRTHFAFALFLGLLMLKFIEVQHYWPFFVLLFLGMLFPDVDHKESFINKRIPLLKIFAILLKHRGVMHSIFPPAIIFLLILYLSSFNYASAFFIGYLSHLIADALTISGVNFLYPIGVFRIHGFVRTGSIMETGLFLLLIVACLLLIAL